MAKKKIIDGSGKVLFDPADYEGVGLTPEQAALLEKLPKTVNKVAPDENGNIDIPRITDDELQKTYIDMGISGTKYDAARQILGGDWRIPTPTDFNELLDNCDITIVLDEGEKGQRYTSRINGNSIFIKLGENWSGWTHFIIDGAIATNYTPRQKPAFSLQYNALPTKITKYNLFNTPRYDPAHIRPVSMTQGVDLGLPSGLHWSATNLSDNGLVTSDKDFGDNYSFGELTSKTTYTWDNYMCKEAECGTSADPLMGYYEELEETDHYLNTRGLNIVRKQINDKIDEVEKGMPQPTPIADADETVHHVLGQEVQDNQVVVQPRSINELSDGSRVADLEEWQRSLGIFSIQRGTEEGSWIINVLDAE